MQTFRLTKPREPLVTFTARKTNEELLESKVSALQLLYQNCCVILDEELPSGVFYNPQSGCIALFHSEPSEDEILKALANIKLYHYLIGQDTMEKTIIRQEEDLFGMTLKRLMGKRKNRWKKEKGTR